MKIHVDEYEKLRRSALSGQLFCERKTATKLWRFSSLGMAEWLNISGKAEPMAAMSHPETAENGKRSEYPREVICVLADMTLANLKGDENYV